MADHDNGVGNTAERIDRRPGALDKASGRIVERQVGRHRLVATRAQAAGTSAAQHELSCQAPWIRQNVATWDARPVAIHARALSLNGSSPTPSRRRSSSFRAARCSGGERDRVRARGPDTDLQRIPRSSKPSYSAVTTAGATRTSASPTADHSSLSSSGLQNRMVAPLVFRGRIERHRRVPEAPQQGHLPGVVPDRGAHRAARMRDPLHLPHSRRRIGHEVEDELRQGVVERVVLERQRLGGRALDLHARQPLRAASANGADGSTAATRSWPSSAASSVVRAPGPEPTSSVRCQLRTPAALMKARASLRL